MRLTQLLDRATLLLTLFAAVSTIYIYNYPFFHGCAFPSPPGHSHAPFRLLALGDPQLEGDTSLPGGTANISFLFQRSIECYTRLRNATYLSTKLVEAHNLTTTFLGHDIPWALATQRKRLDLWGNDYYLAHVYRSVKRWTRPTHITVLGDLLGSQWIGVPEFHSRADRFYSRVFRDAVKSPELGGAWNESVDWTKTLINVAGNHDIGYAGDFDTHRVIRFEERFAPMNWDIAFELSSSSSSLRIANHSGPDEDSPPRINIVVLNSMNLDAPAYNQTLQEESRVFLEQQFSVARNLRPKDAVVLLTHIPLHKQTGLCTDGPFFAFFPEEQSGGISEQNHLGDTTSLGILDGLYLDDSDEGQMKARAGIILNGHDHEGCAVIHRLPSAPAVVNGTNTSSLGDWTAAVHPGHADDLSPQAVREITVRSMMGSYGGNAGLVSGWFDEEMGRWRFEYRACGFGVQHIWWAVHILDIVAVLVLGFTVAVHALGRRTTVVKVGREKKEQ